MRGSAPSWQLAGFLERLDDWVAREAPPEDVRLIVTAWILSRLDDPYQGVRRAAGFPNLWYGVVPKSDYGSDLVVVCSYWIEESKRAVRCDDFASLTRPV